MGLIRFAIENPVKVAVGVILVIMFGLISLLSFPVQLTPNVDKPIITVSTNWIGASPQEIESEIVDRQEDKLKSVTNLKKMTSQCTRGQAKVSLEFPVGVDKDIAYRDVSDKLRQVTGYPEEVDEPVMSATDNDMENIVAWMILFSDNDAEVAKLKTFMEEKVKPILERAQGISEVNVYGGRDREIQIVVDAYEMAARGITFAELENAIRGQNANISAGTVLAGKRDVSYRTIGEFRTMEDVESVVVAYRGGGPVFVRDIATVVDDFKKPVSFVRSKGQFVLAMPARRETGSNVLQAMDNLRAQLKIVNRDILTPLGMNLELTQVYDETTYIRSAISLVRSNILIGGTLSVLVLMLFLRSVSATGIVAVAIPISVIGTFLIIAMLGRSLNVVMLAGMAFAVGMVVDNAIVVLENIYRHRSMGEGRVQAALKGAGEVWGAILASTLTTMAVFLPVIFIEEEAGQLFRDIAIAISAAVAMSLLVSVLVIPPLGARFFGSARQVGEASEKPWFVGSMVAGVIRAISGSKLARIGVVGGLSALSILLSIKLVPRTDYLPSGNKNLVMGVFLSPPGYSIEEFQQMADIVENGDPKDPLDGVRPFFEAKAGEPNNLPPVEIAVGKKGDIIRTVKPPPIENFFFVSFGNVAFMGCTSADPDVVSPLTHVMTNAGRRVPGVLSFANQKSLFSSGRAVGNSVDVEIRSDDLDQVTRVAGMLMGKFNETGYRQVQPDPMNFSLGRPEIQFVPKRTQAADLGLDVRELGFVGEACVDGAFVGEFNDRGDKVDMAIKVAGMDEASMEDIRQVPLVTTTGHKIVLGSVVDLVSEPAQQQIDHIEEMSSVTLSVTPKTGVALQDTISELQGIIGPMRDAGAIPKSVFINLAGTADKLSQTQKALIGDFSGTVTQPCLFGMSVGWTMLLLTCVVASAAVLVGLLAGEKQGVRLIVAGMALLALGFLVVNPMFGASLLQSRMLLALIITYLLMAALFESFVYPFVIMFSVPLAAVGGFAALAIVHRVSEFDITSPTQQLDVLTMLGFVILIGIVVNNAILLVHQALTYMREHGIEPQEAIAKSVETRTRPIFMSALTSIFGMAPLVIMPGAGSELYRGLGSVVVGGLLVSTIFTLIVVPAMFSLVLQMRLWLRSVTGSSGLDDDRAEVPALEPFGGASESGVIRAFDTDR